MKTEFLEEGWVKFRRHQCKEGFIDYWMGDSINNPNESTKSRLQLNSSTAYFRLNGGKWINRREFSSEIHTYLLLLSDECTATEIWLVNLLEQPKSFEDSIPK
jgi:hypothetical protein